jgi:hypothetical protein
MPFTSTRGNRARLRRPPPRSGLTLIEILISTAVTLIMIYAIVEIFERVGSAVAQGRAAIEMSGQIRGAAHRIREDLKGLTVPVRPWPHSASAEGYFMYLEGPGRDKTTIDPVDPLTSFIGDRDDILMFTARTVDEPWVGRYVDPATSLSVAIESQVAEIVWWTRTDPISGNMSLHRRVLLIRPDLNNAAGVVDTNDTDPNFVAFVNNNDISVRLVKGVGIIANTLGDLTKRECRLAHLGTFPHLLDVNAGTISLTNLAQSGLQQGDDVILTHVQGFDIKAFDVTATIRNDGVRALVPSDPGWAAAGAASDMGTGAFVDLNYLGAAGTSVFSGPAHIRSGLNVIAPASVYDTWSFHYEHDGLDQDGSGLADQGTNGFDDNNQNGPDDVLERETSPPYPVPLRGIQIKIRIDDPDSRQVREMTVVHDFIPE